MFRKGRCKGCHGDKPMYKGCPIKACVKDNNYDTCADCEEFYSEFRDCRKLNNLISKICGFVFRSDRLGNIDRIRAAGLEKFKSENV